MINFYLPCIHDEGLNLNILFIKLINKNPEYFLQGLKINSLYGSFENCIFDSGRVNNEKQIVRNWKKNIDIINDLGVSVRMTFTNNLATNINDPILNNILETLNNQKIKNDILINSDILYDYILKKYQNLNLIYSITNYNNNLQELKEISKKYKLVVLDYRLNKIIQKINIESFFKEKIEILLNCYCHISCTQQKEHMKLTSIYNLNLYKHLINKETEIEDRKKIDEFVSLKCPLKAAKLSSFEKNEDIDKWIAAFNRKDICNILTIEELNKLIANGFFNFKLEGRDAKIDYLVFQYLYYMVKPSYRKTVFNIISDNIKINSNILNKIDELC